MLEIRDDITNKGDNGVIPEIVHKRIDSTYLFVRSILGISPEELLDLLNEERDRLNRIEKNIH